MGIMLYDNCHVFPETGPVCQRQKSKKTLFTHANKNIVLLIVYDANENEDGSVRFYYIPLAIFRLQCFC